MAWEFMSPANAAVFTTRRVLTQETTVVRLICDDEGDWQALDDEPRDEGDAVVIALASLLELHPCLTDAVRSLDNRDWGWQAIKQGEQWVLAPFRSS